MLFMQPYVMVQFIWQTEKKNWWVNILNISQLYAGVSKTMISNVTIVIDVKIVYKKYLSNQT